MLFSLVLYMIVVSLVSTALFHVLVHHIEETVAIGLLFYIIHTVSQKNCASVIFTARC